jgi:hypothetical protein
MKTLHAAVFASLGLFTLLGCATDDSSDDAPNVIDPLNAGATAGQSSGGASTSPVGNAGTATSNGGAVTGTATATSNGGAVTGTTTTTSSGGAVTGAGTNTPSTVSTGATLKVSGNQLLDTCGNALVVRGVEQFFNHGIQVNGSFQPIIDGIIATGSNAVRLLPTPDNITAADLDSVIGTFANAQVVVYLSPGDRTWFNRPEIKAVLDKYAAWVIIDAYQEPNFDNRAQWKTEAIAAIRTIRGYGYTLPITVLANLYGRDLPSLLLEGSDVVAADTANNTILGWQAYWGQGGWYQSEAAFDMSIAEGVAAAANQSFPIQIGIDLYADPGETMDYQTAMAEAEELGVGWLWWDYWNPYGSTNSLSRDGTGTNLSDFGQIVVTTDANSISKTSVKACRTK